MIEIEAIFERINSHMDVLTGKYHVKEIGVFGSVIRGEQERGSDVDILVEFTKTPGFFKFIDLEEYLSDILGVKVDLVSKNGIKVSFRENILNEVVCV